MAETPDDDPWAKAPPWAVLGYVLLLLFVLPFVDDKAEMAAWLLLPTLIGTGAGVLLSTSARRPWSGDRYAQVVPVLVLVAAGAMVTARQFDPPAQARTTTAAPRSVQAVTDLGVDASADGGTDLASVSTAPLGLPRDAKAWTRVRSADVLAADAESRQQSRSAYGIRDLVVGTYTTRTGTPTTFRYTGVNGHLPGGTPEVVGRAYLEEAGGPSGGDPVVYPSRADGWLGCTPDQSASTSCAWIGEQRAVLLQWDDAQISTALAASMTRTFRDAASRLR